VSATLHARLRPTLLAVLCFSGTLGLPLTDAAMFHLAGQDPCAGVTHLEAHGGAHHADRCTLAQPCAVQRESLGSAGAIRTVPPLVVYAMSPAATAPAGAEPTALQHSRAPPA
jgi:hypothetical protein